MRLTLGRLKERVAHKAPADRLENRIGAVSERLMLDKKFAGSLHRLALVARYGQLTLPRHYRTIEGARVEGSVANIANLWWEYMPGVYDCSCFAMSGIRDIGDGHALIRDLPLGGTLGLSYPGAPGVVVEVSLFGEDSTGLPTELVLTGTAAQANPFAKIERVRKQQNTPAVSLLHTAADTTVITLAVMEPREEETYFRRYMLDPYTDQVETAVTALCKRRYIEATSDEDVMPFSNISAYELGLDAVQYESENDLAIAKRYWDLAIEVLNSELGDTNANASLPPVRFIHVGVRGSMFRNIT